MKTTEKAKRAGSSLLFRLARAKQKFFRGLTSFIELLSKPKLKIALVSYYYKDAISGVGIHVYNLAKALSKNGCRVHVFCSGDENKAYRKDGVVVHSIGRILTPADDRFSKKRLEYDLFESEVVKEFIRENASHKFDIIHSHGALTKAAFIIKKTHNIKWIHTFHSIEKLRVLELSKEEKQFGDLITWIESTVNYCDGAILVSKALVKQADRHYKLASKIVIPNGVDSRFFSYSPISKKNVLFIGRFSKEKGIDILPEIIPQVMSVKGATFTAVCAHRGLDGELKNIRESIQKQQEIYDERLKVIEQPQDQKIIRNLYRESRVYIQPSIYESFPLCVFEAMATGRPVVAFNVGGLPEVIGDAGFLAKDKKELVSVIKKLLKDKKKCISVGTRASQRANNFDWDTIAKKTIEYYEGVEK